MDRQVILKELSFKAVRSSGPGGQHVNKTASKVAVDFNITTSLGLTDKEKELLVAKLEKRISSEGNITLTCSQSRSQHRNKALVIDRLFTLLTRNLTVAKPRKKTKLSKAAIEKRLKAKKNQALKKAHRKPPSVE